MSSRLAPHAGVIGKRMSVMCVIIAVIGYSSADTDDDFNKVNFGGGCPSSCSGHGYCTSPKTENCSCHQGWGGGDCSIRELRRWSKRVDYLLIPTFGHAFSSTFRENCRQQRVHEHQVQHLPASVSPELQRLPRRLFTEQNSVTKGDVAIHSCQASLTLLRDFSSP